MNKLVDIDTHLSILNFLGYIQSIGVIAEDQRTHYEEYIQQYIKYRKNMEELLNK